MFTPLPHHGADIEEILSAVKSWILSTVADATPSNVVITQIPDDPPPDLPGLFYWTISWGDGRFDSNLWAGAARNTLADTTNVYIGIYSSALPDQPSRDDNAMLGSAGIPAKMRKLVGSFGEWMPTNSAGTEGLLMQPLEPVGYEAPKRISSNFMRARVFFQARFLWRLGELPQLGE